MKAAVLYGKNDLRIVEVDKPKIGPTDILVKVKACAVCPTDIRRYRTGSRKVHGQDRTFNFPLNSGHEWTGEVVEVGEGVKGFRKGMRISAGGVFGGYAKYTSVPQHFIRLDMVLELPDNVSYEEGTFVEPLADCIHAVRDRSKVKAGDTIAIIGAGQMGLQQLMVAKNIAPQPLL